MKIEIDLNEILGDEDGVETLQESVRRQVIEKLISTVKGGIEKQITYEVSKAISETLSESVKAQMPALVDDLMNAEFAPVDRYGDKAKTTTFRRELIKTINEQMIYKKENYDSHKTPFTLAVDQVVGAHMAKFGSEFNKTVDTKFVQEAMEYATAKLAERLRIKN